MTQPAPTTTLEAERQAAQLAFEASGAELAFGEPQDLPWPIDALAACVPGQPPVVELFDSGLTAQVFRLRSRQSDWTLKRARPQALVKNTDGQTSFLNEVQRRIDLAALKQRDPAGPARWAAIVDTRYASYRRGLILSPWIEGQPVADWDERRLAQILYTACALWTEGFFEWDLCSGNILDDGRQLQLFDFGYMYRFDPRRHFNTAGCGTDVPLFHPAERFETRNHSGHLLALADTRGEAAALAAFRLEKTIALETYRWMRATIAERGASATVLAWLDDIVRRWDEALGGSAEALYWAEQWRSHVLDLDDDLRGHSCTPMTLRRADWLLHALTHHADALQAQQALFWGDEHKSRDALHADYAAKRRLAEHRQLSHHSQHPHPEVTT